MLLVVVMMEARVRQLIEARGQHVRRLGAGRLVKLALAIPLAQLIHCIAVAMASVRRGGGLEWDHLPGGWPLESPPSDRQVTDGIGA